MSEEEGGTTPLEPTLTVSVHVVPLPVHPNVAELKDASSEPVRVYVTDPLSLRLVEGVKVIVAVSYTEVPTDPMPLLETQSRCWCCPC